MAALEIYANQPSTTVSSGGTDAPASGTQETWTVASSSEFPAASSSATPPTQFHVADALASASSELIAVVNVSGDTWTVIRGSESTTPVAHVSGFSVYQVVTAGGLRQASRVDWYNVVTMFGADPTGTSDSTTAIQAAITTANATSGAVVYFPQGTYNFTALTWKSFAYLEGDGEDVSILQCTSSTGGISGTSVEYAGMRKLQINGPGSHTGSGVGINLAWTASHPNAFLDFENVLVESFGSHSIQIQNPIVTSFRKVVTGSGGRGFYLTGTPGGAAGTSVSMNSCYAVGNGLEGYYLQTLAYCSLNGCASDQNAVGYTIAGCQGVTLSGCGAESTAAGSSGLSGDSFHITDDSSSSHCYCLTLNGCWSYANNAVAFSVLANQQSITLIGPTENTPGVSASASIKTASGSSVTVIGESVSTATSYTSGTVATLQDGSGNMSIPGTLKLTSGALIQLGSSLDTDLYRLAAGSLATDGLFTAYGGVSPAGGNTLSAGSGAPGKPVGNPTAGDIYFRTDATGTSDERIYICTTGGSSPAWSGIV